MSAYAMVGDGILNMHNNLHLIGQIYYAYLALFQLLFSSKQMNDGKDLGWW
jgi:hypothetical protein